MNFTAPLFFFFFILVFTVRWGVSFFFRQNSEKTVFFSNLILVLFSYYFYMSWDWRFGFLILFTTILDFSSGRLMDKFPQNKKAFLLLSVVTNLTVLGFFKYFNFFLENARRFAELLGLNAHVSALEILLPAGISFFTFQSMSYTIDLYRGVISVEKSFLRYALFLSFFPQLVAGPIVAAKDFLPQIRVLHKFSEIQAGKSLYFLLLGFLKKSVFADQVSVLSDFVFGHPDQVSGFFTICGVISYSIQIYCDFSGYSDIARGAAFALGFELPENFQLPYFSKSLTEFWRRWHISLSSWLKSYLYISLGGNKCSNLVTYRNLFITMLLGGLWHGASWNFIIWGGLHGMWLAFERMVAGLKFWEKAKNFLENYKPSRILSLLYSVWIFFLVSALWIFFRSPDLKTAMLIFQNMFFFKEGIDPTYSTLNMFYAIAACSFLAHLVGTYRSSAILEFFENLSLPRSFAISLAVIFGVLLSGNTRPFIYFVF